MITKHLHSDEHLFLQVPQAWGKEFVSMLKVVFEFIKGFRKFHSIGSCATVFGSASFSQEHPYCDLARRMGAELAKLGFTVMTGGGPGIMEAANRGAKEAGAMSVGCNIVLSSEQKPNE